MSQRTRDVISVASLTLSVIIAITGVAFWAGSIDGIVRNKVSEVEADEEEGARNVTDRIVEEVKDRLSIHNLHPPLGTIVAYAGRGSIPDGWALCAGQEIPTPNDLPPEFGMGWSYFFGQSEGGVKVDSDWV